jgi:uncharacterized membrane protein
MNLLRKIFFFIPYPQAILAHIILGASVAAIIGAIVWDYRGYGYTIPVVGAVIGIIVGALVALILRPKQ